MRDGTNALVEPASKNLRPVGVTRKKGRRLTVTDGDAKRLQEDGDVLGGCPTSVEYEGGACEGNFNRRKDCAQTSEPDAAGCRVRPYPHAYSKWGGARDPRDCGCRRG